MRAVLCSITIVFSVLFSQAAAQRGYILTAPTRFIPGRPEKICVDLMFVSDDVSITFTLEAVSGSVLPATRFFNQTLVDRPRLSFRRRRDFSKCVEVTIPKEVSANYIGIHMVGRSRRWNFEGDALVQTYKAGTAKTITFIQTDKPVYRPGELVRFRVITLDTTLSKANDQISLMYIRTPSKTRVHQWKDRENPQGLLQFDFQLSEEPELGEWKIEIEFSDRTETQTFEVEKYVLPKFEVTVKPPSYLTLAERDVEFDVCAEYTFGQAVKGTVEAEVCLQRFGFAYAGKPCAALRLELSKGCGTVVVSRTDGSWFDINRFLSNLKLKFTASVREDGTDVLLSATPLEVEFLPNDVKISLDGGDKFKPGLAYNGKLSTKRVDGSAAPNQRVEIRLARWIRGQQDYVSTYTTDNVGVAYFTIPPTASILSTVEIKATTVGGNLQNGRLTQATASRKLTGWYSPSGSFLQIEPLKEPLTCRSTATFTVSFTTSRSARVTVFTKIVGVTDISSTKSTTLLLRKKTPIASRDPTDRWDSKSINYNWWAIGTGNGYQQVFATHHGKFTVRVTLQPDVSPKGSLVVYYVRSDKEVVADSIELNLPPCTENEVRMDFSKPQVLPGEAVDLAFVASPNSLCGYGVVDKSVFLLGGNNQLTTAQVLQTISSHSLPKWGGYDSRGFDFCPQSMKVGPFNCGNNNCLFGNPIITPRSSYKVPYDSAFTGFEHGGLIISSTFDHTTGLCIQDCPIKRCRAPPTIRPQPCGVFGCFNRGGNGLNIFGGNAGPDGNENGDGNEKGNVNGNGNGANGIGDNNGNGNGNGNIPIVLPNVIEEPGFEKLVEPEEDQIRELFPEAWLWDLVITDRRGHATVQSEAPDTITEWIGNAVCLDDSEGLGVSPAASLVAFKPFFVSMNLPYSVIRSERIPIAVSVFNYLEQCLTVRVTFGESDMYNIVDDDNQRTICVCSRDTVVEEFMIVMNEIGDVNVSVNIVSVSNQGLCPPGSDHSRETGLSDAVVRPMIVEPEGAPREYTVGDFVCLLDGEELEFDFELPLPADNALVQGSDRGYTIVTGDVMGPALSNLEGLLRMPHGCGEQTMLSLAPDVFILEYLTAVRRDEPEITDKAIALIEKGYQRELTFGLEDGSYAVFGQRGPPASIWLTAFVVKCFGLATPYVFIDQERQAKSIQYFEKVQRPDGCFPQLGKVIHKGMQGGLAGGANTAALTAYVLIAMIESGEDIGSKSIERGFECLNGQSPPDVYTQALIAYAYALYDDSDKSRVDALMNNAMTSGGLTHFQATSNPPVPTGRHHHNRPVSADVETSAYALMTILRVKPSNWPSTSLALVRWLSNQRNSRGGFASTQDTVIGLQALSKYAFLTHSGNLNVDMTVHELLSGNEVAEFSVNDDNKLVEFSSKLPRVVDLQLRASGSGCFLFQANVKYNVKAVDDVGQAFATRVNTRAIHDITCTAQFVNICTKYTRGDDISNMAVVEVKMQSGWEPDELSLENLLEDEDVALMRYEIDPLTKTVQLYFDGLTNQEKCFEFEIFRQFAVDNPQPAVITTYDYYELELRQETSYLIDC